MAHTAALLLLNYWLRFTVRSSNRIYNRVGDFSCGRMVGRGPRFLCLFSTGSAIEICLWDLRSPFSGVRYGDGGYPGCWIMGEFSQSIIFMNISFIFDYKTSRFSSINILLVKTQLFIKRGFDIKIFFSKNEPEEAEYLYTLKFKLDIKIKGSINQKYNNFIGRQIFSIILLAIFRSFYPVYIISIHVEGLLKISH